ncbi:MAG: BBE domain-containing protein [Pseudomonadota bacterium]|nr:BBE domain-containing protein [Pseudomonadota bacterium]
MFSNFVKGCPLGSREGGIYVNFFSEGDEKVTKTYGENSNKLVKLKTKYDPEN